MRRNRHASFASISRPVSVSSKAVAMPAIAISLTIPPSHWKTVTNFEYAEFGLFRSDTNVAGQSQLKPSTNGMAVYCSDNGLGDPMLSRCDSTPNTCGNVSPHIKHIPLFPFGNESFQVCSREECLACTREYSHIK